MSILSRAVFRLGTKITPNITIVPGADGHVMSCPLVQETGIVKIVKILICKALWDGSELYCWVMKISEECESEKTRKWVELNMGVLEMR